MMHQDQSWWWRVLGSLGHFACGWNAD